MRSADGTEVAVPTEIFKILFDVANQLQCGRGVAVVPSDRLLTTQEGADLPGVSRPTFVKMLEDGKIPFSRVGRHRRVTLEDLKEYFREEQVRRAELLREVAASTQETETFYQPPAL